MPSSMTGFGRGAAKGKEVRYVAEIRSVNCRYCEVDVRAPKGLLGLEHEISQRLRAVFTRGKFEVALRTEALPGVRPAGVDENEVMTRWRALEKIRRKLKLPDPLPLAAVLQGMELAPNGDHAPDPDAEKKFLTATEEAIRTLRKVRDREGETLVRDMRRRVEVLGKAVERIHARAEECRPVRMEKLRVRVSELAGGHNLERSRLETELALLVERSDVTEEIVRLRSHLERLEAFFDSREPVGRNVDFLIQELHRETNTIGSKSADLDVTGDVLILKAEIEKIREQAQNLE